MKSYQFWKLIFDRDVSFCWNCWFLRRHALQPRSSQSSQPAPNLQVLWYLFMQSSMRSQPALRKEYPNAIADNQSAAIERKAVPKLTLQWQVPLPLCSKLCNLYMYSSVSCNFCCVYSDFSNRRSWQLKRMVLNALVASKRTKIRIPDLDAADLHE